MVITTGFFDGVHLGHRYLLSQLVAEAKARGDHSMVVTFWPHPRTVLQQDARELRLLTSLQEKKDLILGQGVDFVEVLPFSKQFAELTAVEYLSMLHERFGADVVLMGYDNRIGSDRLTADSVISTDRSEQRNLPPIEIKPLAALSSDDLPSISSTKIRKALESGDIALANSMLGYEYRLHGVVVAGNQMGRRIGFPTANMKLYEPLKLIPLNGVYCVRVHLPYGDSRLGMCNIGVRPTIGGGGLTIETNIFGFNDDIYGLDLKIDFLERIRPERKFGSFEELRQQLQEDKTLCLKIGF